MNLQSEALPKTRKSPRPRTCGFQISWVDSAVILFCGITTWLLWPYIGQMSLLFPVALGHFFLFCNVFRISRELEYLWAASFVVLFLVLLLIGKFSWWLVLAIQSPTTIILILSEMRTLWYHGIGARIINKDIETYLRGDKT